MRKIKYFENFRIDEALGIAIPTQFYVNRLTYIVLEEFYNYVDSTRYSGEESETLSYEVVVTYSDLKSMIPSGGDSLEQYAKFPLSEIIIDLSLYKQSVEEMDGADFKVGGYASPFAKGRENRATRFKNPMKQLTDHSLSVHLGLSFYYSKYFRKINFSHPHFENTNLFKKVESVISHELNHLYEFYNRKLNRAPSIKVAPTMAALSDNIYDVPKSIYDKWSEDFSGLVYNSEWHEINAQTQEALSYVKRLPLERFKRTRLWKEAEKMKNWSYKEFLNELKDEIKDEGMDDTTIDRMKEYFCIEMQNWTTQLNEMPEYDPWKLFNKPTDKFFEFFEKKIKKAGETLQRNFLRLYATKD